VWGNRLSRDGRAWTPHGFHQIAFVVLPGVRDAKPFFLIASQNYSPREFVEMREADADSVRIRAIPCGLSDGLPASTVLVGRHFDEPTIYLGAHAFEQSGGWTSM
jgi:Asp-tRNA(Asn)/Glu-tRNA(Gln) amidotransferase A subunit family amidase